MYTHASGRQSETAYAILVLFAAPMERAKINLYKKLATAAKKIPKKIIAIITSEDNRIQHFQQHLKAGFQLCVYLLISDAFTKSHLLRQRSCTEW